MPQYYPINPTNLWRYTNPAHPKELCNIFVAGAATSPTADPTGGSRKFLGWGLGLAKTGLSPGLPNVPCYPFLLVFLPRRIVPPT